MRVEPHGELASTAQRTAKIAAQIEVRHRIQKDFLNRISFAFDLPKHLGMERCLFRHRVESGRRPNLPPQKFPALLPLRQSTVRGMPPEGLGHEVSAGIRKIDIPGTARRYLGERHRTHGGKQKQTYQILVAILLRTLVSRAVLHHEHDPLHRSDIGYRVAVYRDNIGELARFNSAHPVQPTH